MKLCRLLGISILLCAAWPALCGAQNAQPPGLAANDAGGPASGGAPGANGGSAFLRSTIDPATVKSGAWVRRNPGEGVDWEGLIKQSFFFLGLQHTFRLATEPGTRAGMKGRFFQGWMEAATNLNGWSDGDAFYVNYVGHTLQGASTGYLWAQNDRDFLDVEFGRDSRYWKSRLRAATFATAYSAQFELGPFSEASIGKIQARYPQQGMVDTVVTPVVGTGWMIAEDAVDKYFIKWFERKVGNPYLRLIVRGGLNPARSWANAMRWKVPWARDTRPGVFSQALTPYLERDRSGSLIGRASRKPVEREGQFGVARAEFAMEARPLIYFGGAESTPCLGGGMDLALRMSRTTQLVFDMSGCKLARLGENLSGDTLTYLMGTRWTPRPSSRWSPFAHVLVGGTRATQKRYYPELEAALKAAAKKAGREEPAHEEYTTKYQEDAFALSAGTGLDLRVNPALAVRLASVEYRRSWLPAMNGREFENGISFKTSVILRMGTW